MHAAPLCAHKCRTSVCTRRPVHARPCEALCVQAVASTVVNLMAQHAMPLRAHYTRAMNEATAPPCYMALCSWHCRGCVHVSLSDGGGRVQVTPDFSDVHALEKLSVEELRELLETTDWSSISSAKQAAEDKIDLIGDILRRGWRAENAEKQPSDTEDSRYALMNSADANTTPATGV